MQQGLGQARELGGGVGRREVKGELDRARSSETSLEPPLQKSKAGAGAECLAAERWEEG